MLRFVIYIYSSQLLYWRNSLYSFDNQFKTVPAELLYCNVVKIVIFKINNLCRNKNYLCGLSAGLSLPDLLGGGQSGQQRATHRLMAGLDMVSGNTTHVRKKVPQKITTTNLLGARVKT